MNPGDRVAYSRQFLRSVQAYIGPTAFDRGTVTDFDPHLDIVTVQFDGFREPRKVLKPNLVLVSRLHLEPV